MTTTRRNSNLLTSQPIEPSTPSTALPRARWSHQLVGMNCRLRHFAARFLSELLRSLAVPTA